MRAGGAGVIIALLVAVGIAGAVAFLFAIALVLLAPFGVYLF